MESDLNLLAALLDNPFLTMDEARRDADAAAWAEVATTRRTKPARTRADAAVDCGA